MNAEITNVLLIEDDEDDYVLTRTMLSRKPFNIVWKQSLAEAVQHLASHSTDAILLDLSLLDTDGVNALDALSTYAKQIPIVVLTGLEDEKVVAEALQRGAQDYLMKSKITAELVERSLRYSIMRKQTEKFARKISLFEQREDFMAMLTHDLKNPIIGATRLLEMFGEGELGDLTDDQKGAVQQLRASNKKVLIMIHNLLEAYKLETDVANNITLSPLDILPMLQSSLKEVSPLVQNKKLQVKLEIADNVPQVLADTNSFSRVIQNLLDNAIKFSHDGGVITVRLSHAGDTEVLEIHNNGPIINSEDQMRLFERFWQGVGGKKYTAGTGLGLYLCKHIVAAHNGQISCTSNEIEGTTFAVKLPLSKINVSAVKTGTTSGKV